jgi:hypothetical protein
MSELTDLWHAFTAKLAELKGKIDPAFHKDVDEVAAKADAIKKKTEETAQVAVAEEKPVVTEAVKAAVQVAEAAAATEEKAL